MEPIWGLPGGKRLSPAHSLLYAKGKVKTSQAAPAWKSRCWDEWPSTACFTAMRPIAPLPPYRNVRLAPGHGLTRYQYW
jgi:hypothetical protein